MPKIRLKRTECTLCGTCIEVCPMGVFEKKEDRTVIVNEGECIACRSCEVQCPAQCICIEEE